MPRSRPNNEPFMLRGSLFTFRRRCGKPNCRCASGEPHESPALSYLEAGKAKTLTLTGVDLDEVRSALARYNEAKAELERRADAGVATLRARLGSSRGGQRR
ncbi:MAG: DUF6788 family protein [Acidimicrobiales bacterium]